MDLEGKIFNKRQENHIELGEKNKTLRTVALNIFKAMLQVSSLKKLAQRV